MTIDPRFAPPPAFVGPPPLPPRPVHREELGALHVVHLILSIFTAGFWLIIWAMAAMNVSARNEQERKRYERELRQYALAYEDWQRRFHYAYGYVPH